MAGCALLIEDNICLFFLREFVSRDFTEGYQIDLKALGLSGMKKETNWNEPVIACGEMERQ